jgi:hypothetical protein
MRAPLVAVKEWVRPDDHGEAGSGRERKLAVVGEKR